MSSSSFGPGVVKPPRTTTTFAIRTRQPGSSTPPSNGSGKLDILINNAGIVRDHMLVNMTIEDWDAVIAVHLRGTFATVRAAAAHWRGCSKGGSVNEARIVNTTSAAGLYGNLGQTNYGAAKAGIAAFTIIAAGELGRYGVTVNAVAPGARTANDRASDTRGLSAGACRCFRRLGP